MEALTRPFFHHRRKLSNASSSNGLSFSGKDAYDDVLATASKVKFGAASGFAPRGVAVEDYGDVFCGGTAKHGSSIPVLDLSDLDRDGSGDLRSSNKKLDYSKIFGGFAGDDDIATAVPPYEELFAGVKKAKCDKTKARTPTDIGSALKGSDHFNSSENNSGFSSEASDELLGGGKQVNMSYHKTSQHNKDGSNGTTHVAQLHAVPGFTYFIDESAHPQKTSHDKPIPPVKTEVNHNRSFSGDIPEGKSGRRAKWKLPDTQASEVLINGRDDRIQDQSHSNDKLFSFGELNFKSHPSKVPPPSRSSANLNDRKGHSKLSKSSTFCPKIETSEKDASGYLTPSSDEELDVNSAAAASADALKKAIQQAQESIRIAKELMERRKDPIQNSKARSKPSLKVKDIRETNYDQDMSRVRENDIEGACECTNTVVQAFAGFDQKIARESDQVASTFKLRENLSIERKAEVENHEESAEVAEEQGVAMWFTQLLNRGKNKIAALAFQPIDNKNNNFQSASKHTCDVEETKPAMETLENGTIEKMKTVARVLYPGDIGAELNALGTPVVLENNVVKSNSAQSVHEGKVSVTLGTAPEDGATKKIPDDFDEEDKCEKKLDCQVKMDDRQFESENLENGCLANAFVNLVERKKEEQMSFQIKAEKKLDDVGVWEDNETRLAEDEIERKQEEESCLWKGNEDKPKAAIGNESNGKKQDFQEEDSTENRVGGYHLQDSDEQRSAHSLYEVLRQNMSDKECLWEGIDQRPGGTCQTEVTDHIDAEAAAQNQKLKVNREGEEIDNAQGKTDKSEENPGADLFPDSADEENLSASLDACINDDSTNLGETPEACRSEVENISEQISQLGIRNFGENGNLAGMTEQTSRPEDRNDEEIGTIDLEEDDNKLEQAEEVVRLKQTKIFETSLKDETIAEENILESIIQDVSEGPASDDHNEKFVFSPATDNKNLSAGFDYETTSSIHSDSKDHAIENNAATVAPPPVEVSAYFGFTDMNGQKEIEESDEVSEFAIGPENKDGLVHESGENAENVMEDGIASEEEVKKNNIELDRMERDRVEKQKETNYSQLPGESQGSEEHRGTDTETKTGQSMENYGPNLCNTFSKEEKETEETGQKEVGAKDHPKKIEVNKRERECEMDRVAVERAICEARERAFTEARERAERAAVERATTEVRERAMAEAREKLEKVSSGTKVSTDKASIEAKLRAERAAVERATAEARERALEKALSQKTTSETRVQAENFAGRSSGVSRDAGTKNSFSSSDLERFDETHNESAQRRKARLERHQRIMERAAKALAEKNMRDILAQREQAERNRLAETLDADIKRWASGKEGNLRALLSTLQYILGPNSGWQSISLTEIITTSAVKKAYRKATLYVHPDKLQQRGASIQQKYISEKVFDLLKAAWNKFNSEER